MKNRITEGIVKSTIKTYASSKKMRSLEEGVQLLYLSKKINNVGYPSPPYYEDSVIQRLVNIGIAEENTKYSHDGVRVYILTKKWQKIVQKEFERV